MFAPSAMRRQAFPPSPTMRGTATPTGSASTSREGNPAGHFVAAGSRDRSDRPQRKEARARGRLSRRCCRCVAEGIGNGSILCTDGWSGFRRVVRESQASHVVVGSPVKQEEASEDRPVPQLDSEGGKLSLGRVNALHQDLKTFINGQAKGVSTRHLQGYLNWTQAVWKPVLRRCHVVLASRAPREVGKSLLAQRE